MDKYADKWYSSERLKSEFILYIDPTLPHPGRQGQDAPRDSSPWSSRDETELEPITYRDFDGDFHSFSTHAADCHGAALKRRWWLPPMGGVSGSAASV